MYTRIPTHTHTHICSKDKGVTPFRVTKGGVCTICIKGKNDYKIWK